MPSPKLTRRNWMARTSAAAAAYAAGIPFVHATNKSGSRNPILGSGAFKYECIHDWGMDSLPGSAHYGNASHGVTIDEAGQIYVTHQGDPGSIFVFDPAGKFVKSMGDFHQIGSGDKKAAKGHGIDIRKEGNEEFLYLAASDATLDFAKMNLKGELVWRRGKDRLHKDSGAYQRGVRYRPTNTSFSPDGGYFLGDGYGGSFIHQYDAKDNYVRTIGGNGTADGKFQTPHGQWHDDRDGTAKLVVADRANKRLQWFDMQGKHLKTLDGFLFPADIDCQGDVLLVPDLHCRITLLDKQNQVIAHLGDDPAWREKVLTRSSNMRARRKDWIPGKFVHPHDACFDRDGNIFVAEWVRTGRLTKLRKV